MHFRIAMFKKKKKSTDLLANFQFPTICHEGKTGTRRGVSTIAFQTHTLVLMGVNVQVDKQSQPNSLGM